MTAALAVLAGLAAPAPAGAAENPPAARAYEPIVHLDFSEMRFEAPVSLSSRFEDVTRYTLDEKGTTLKDSALYNQVRIGARFDSKMALIPLLVFAEYEHDLVAGYTYNRPELPGVDLPNHEEPASMLRKLWGRVSLGPYLHAGGGFMTSHFGLGLIANDGAHGWTPGSARFTEPYGGDRVLRAFLATGPLTEDKIFATVAYDEVIDDDVLLDSDSAHQITAAILIGRNQPKWVGLYVARRIQDSPSGRRTRANVVDLAASARFELGDGAGAVIVESEVALIGGTTELAGSADYPEHSIGQHGAAIRAAYDGGIAGAVLDFVYASGDRDLDDGMQAGFKADPNYSMGLLLFQHVLAAQTARAPISASDPNLVGRPPDDVERFPTRGSITNTVAFAPRGFWRPLEGLELYGGPVFAFAAAPLVDPFHTRVAGGVPRNAFDSSPGDYLGTEIDAGVRWRTLVEGTELTLGLEYGVLFPGNAFATQGGGTMDTISGGRALVSYRL